MESTYPLHANNDALNCLDLEKAPAVIRDTGGQQLALKLYEILTVADYRYPSPTAEGTVVIYRQPSGKRIALAQGEDGFWRFDDETLTGLGAMHEVLIGKGSLQQKLKPHLSIRLLGLYVYQWILLFLILLLSFLLARLVLYLTRTSLRRGFPKLDEWAPPGVLRGFPWTVVSIVFWATLPVVRMDLAYLVVYSALAKAFTTLALIWFGFGLIDVMAAYIPHSRTYKKVKLQNVVIPMAARSGKAFIACIGLLFFAQNLDLNVWSLFAGFSVVGAAVALAGQDFIKNLFGSVTVVLDRPFDIGDWITVDGVEGTVEDLGFRSTRIRTFYNSLVTLPNALLLTAKVDNYGAREYRRYRQLLHLTHGTPPAKIEAFCEGIRELVRLHPYTRKDYYHVVLNDVTPDAVQVLLYIFWSTPDWSTELRERHRLLGDILLLASRMGIEFAPQMTRIKYSQHEQPEESSALYPQEDYRKAIDDGCRQAREIVEAACPDGAGPVEILEKPRSSEGSWSTG